MRTKVNVMEFTTYRGELSNTNVYETNVSSRNLLTKLFALLFKLQSPLNVVSFMIRHY